MLSCLSHNFKITLADFNDETIGASFTFESFAILGSIVGKPAPDIIKSIPALIAVFTYSA
ncbi:Uncharacterised protein [Clostridioides difficile]|nr:Uncharacterised protein [Clostridioides difficile]